MPQDQPRIQALPQISHYEGYWAVSCREGDPTGIFSGPGGHLYIFETSDEADAAIRDLQHASGITGVKFPLLLAVDRDKVPLVYHAYVKPITPGAPDAQT